MDKIGFAGLGIMGRGMVRNLVAKGWPVTVWNRSPERVQQLGVDVATAGSPRELAEQVDVVICCVSDPPAVERVVFADDGVMKAARPGLAYIESSTVSPGLVRRMASAFSAVGASMLDAPVTGSRIGANQGSLVFMTGGAAELHLQLEPLLLAMGTRAIHCGPSGQGALAKLVNNTLVSFMLEGLCEGLVVAQKGGLPIARVLAIVAASGLAASLYADKGAAIQARNFETHFALDLLVKDQTLMLAEAASQRSPLPGLAAIREVFQAARAQGLGQQDMSAVIRVLERGAGLE